MENLFLKYMGDRLESSPTRQAHQGPVITISRECGCPGNDIAEMLMNKLNKKMVKDGHAPKWKWVNKEILLKASEELKMNPRDGFIFSSSDAFNRISLLTHFHLGAWPSLTIFLFSLFISISAMSFPGQPHSLEIVITGP